MKKKIKIIRILNFNTLFLQCLWISLRIFEFKECQPETKKALICLCPLQSESGKFKLCEGQVNSNAHLV